MFNFLIKRTKEERELIKNSSKISKGFSSIFNGKKIDEELLGQLEEVLISSDMNVHIVENIINFIRNTKFNKDITTDDIKSILYTRLSYIFKDVKKEDITFDKKPYVMVFLGVNGSGKTTTVGKLAYKLKNNGKKVLLAGCDTFRIGASEQLDVWAKRVDVDIVLKEKEGQDPASVVYKAYNKAIEENYDVLLVDTAGRLPNNANLMNELVKIINVIKKINPEAPHQKLIVLDATIGQNSNGQASMFNEAINIDGIIMNKFDGTSKGGALVSIVNEIKKPILAVGVGEKIDDIRDFDEEIYLKNLLGMEYEERE